MGRWKPPPPESSPYITQSGYARLGEEVKALWLKRREVVSALSAAAAEGDRSENAEYIYRKKELGGIDYRIRYLQKRLPRLAVVKDSPASDKVFFGAWVTLIDDAGNQERYRIVGPDEAGYSKEAISMDSPLAQLLLGSTVGKTLTVGVDANQRLLKLTAIDYE